MKFAFPYFLICTLTLFSIRSLSSEFRDPTRPPVVSAGAPMVHEPVPILSAVMGTSSARVAIFNGHLVRAGSHVGEFLIETVFETGVRYRHAGATQEVYMARSINAVKKPSAAAPRSPAGAP